MIIYSFFSYFKSKLDRNQLHLNMEKNIYKKRLDKLFVLFTFVMSQAYFLSGFQLHLLVLRVKTIWLFWRN